MATETETATVTHGNYRVSAKAVAVANTIPKCGRDRVLLAEALLRAGWRSPETQEAEKS